MEINPALYSKQMQMNDLKLNQKEAKAAKEFEGLFMQMVLKEMRPKDLSGGLMGAGQAEEMFYQFFDEAVATEMSKSSSNGLGLAEAVERDYF